MIARYRPPGQKIPDTELILRPDGSLYHLGIHPECIAGKVIIVGDPERVPLISRLFDHIEFRIRSRELVVHTGTFQGRRITVLSSGIGVDNIDIVINELDAAVNIDLIRRTPVETPVTLEIVRIGTSGALHAEIPPGSFVASAMAFGLDGVPMSYEMELEPHEIALEKALRRAFPHLNQHEGLYAVAAHDQLLRRIAPGMIEGITATANGFYGPQGRSARLISRMEPLIDGYAGFHHQGLRITNFEMECAGIYALSSLLGHRALTVCVILANRATKEFHSNPSASMELLIQQVLERF